MSKPNPHDRDLNKEKQQKEEQLERERFIQKQLRNDRIALMQTPEFRRVIADILGRAKIHESTFTGNAHSNFLEGKRSLGLEILHGLYDAVGADAYDLFKLTFGEDFDG